MRILYVEDDVQTGQLVQETFYPNIQVELAVSCQTGKSIFDSTDLDAILLDYYLPDGSGEELCAYVRTQNPHIPILFLTTADKVDTLVKVMDLGADDYLVKPFVMAELKARLQALLRRQLRPVTNHIQAGNVSFNVTAGQVMVEEQPVSLTKTERIILERLLLHAHSILPKSTIESYIWGDSDRLNSNALEVHVRRLRLKLAKANATVQIVTERGVGYRLSPNPGFAVAQSTSVLGPSSV